jgi:hypothetical protein
MNTISVLDKLCMWLLQQQNVKRDTIEKKITATSPPTHPTPPTLPTPLIDPMDSNSNPSAQVVGDN